MEFTPENHNNVWVDKTTDKEEPKWHLKGRNITVWVKKIPKVNGYVYSVLINNKKINTFDNLVDAKKSMVKKMNKINSYKERLNKLSESLKEIN